MRVAETDLVRGLGREMRCSSTYFTKLAIEIQWLTIAYTLSGNALSASHQQNEEGVE